MDEEQRNDWPTPGSVAAEMFDAMARVFVPMVLFVLFLTAAGSGMRTGARCFGLLFACSIVFQVLEARANRRRRHEARECKTRRSPELPPATWKEDAVDARDPTSEAQVFVSDPDGTISTIL